MRVGIFLDEYEVANLLSLLEVAFCGNHHDPVSALDTGDWCGQILFKLREQIAPMRDFVLLKPNATPEQLVERVLHRIATTPPSACGPTCEPTCEPKEGGG